MTTFVTFRCLAAAMLISLFVVHQPTFAVPQVSKAPMNARQKDFSFSQSIDVKWKKGKAFVTFKQQRGKKTATKRYTVSNMEELKDQNLAAYQLYLQSQGVDAGTLASKSSDLKLIPNSSSTSRRTSPSDRPSGGSGSSFAGGGWQVSGMTNSNGNIQRFNDSGTFGNGTNGSGTSATGQKMNDQMANQLKQMIQQSDNPQIKQMLENMLKQGGRQ